MDNLTSTSLNSTDRDSGDPLLTRDYSDLTNLLYKISTPLLLLLTIIGSVLGILTLVQPKIRCHSSATYLLVLFILDVTTIPTEFMQYYTQALGIDLVNTDTQCKCWMFFLIFNRVAAGWIVAALAFERIAILADPRRNQAVISIQYVCAAISTCLLVAIGLGAFSSFDFIHSPHHLTRCSHHGTTSKDLINAKNWLLQIVLVGATALQGLFNIILGALIAKKKIQRLRDPVNASVAAARRKALQFNRINLIVLVITLQSLFVIIPRMLSTRLQHGIAGNHALAFTILRIVSHFVLALRFFLLLLVSPKFRAETREILLCRNYQTGATFVDNKGRRQKIVLKTVQENPYTLTKHGNRWGLETLPTTLTDVDSQTNDLSMEQMNEVVEQSASEDSAIYRKKESTPTKEEQDETPEQMDEAGKECVEQVIDGNLTFGLELHYEPALSVTDDSICEITVEQLQTALESVEIERVALDNQIS